MLSSLVERSLTDEVDWGDPKIKVRNDWNEKISQALDRIASVNPYLPDVPIGEEIAAIDAASWKATRGVDCRPKLYDGVSKSWKLCDTGSMCTVIKRSPEDVIDSSKVLQAVNGSVIKCYGQKQIQIRLGRKTYPIMAVIADVNQDILGWDFIARHKLNFEWTDFGDLCLMDRKAKIKVPLKCVTLPAESALELSLVDPGSAKLVQNQEIAAFEFASMQKFEIAAAETEIAPKYKKLIEKFPNLLKPNFNDLSTRHNVTHKIQTGDATPCKSKVRPLMPNSEKAIKGKEAWDQMERLGVVEKVQQSSNTDWSSALHLVPKSDGSLRPCSDFRQLNAKSIPDSYPIPALKTFSRKLHGSKIFSVIDLQAAFHNVIIEPSDVPKTTTLTPWGVYVYKRMAFGLSGAPSTFMKLVDTVLQGIDGLFCYLDDFLVHAPDEQTHFQILEQVFDRLHEAGLSINLKKCQIGQKKVEYLGYEVSHEGIKPLSRKVSVITSLKSPSNQKDLLHFMGALGYFRSSLKGLKSNGVYRNPAEIMQVLFNLATCKIPSKTKFESIWSQNPKMEEAFQDCKKMLENAVLLTHPDPHAKLALCTDSSDFSIGGSLEQLGKDGKYHPLGLFSKHLDPSKQKWSTYRKELYGCVQSLRHFLPEFYGRHITIYSDHLPLTKSFQSESLQSNDPVAQRQLIEIGMFTKDVQYLPAAQNHMADWLSRRTNEAKIGEAYKTERKEKGINFVKEEEVDFAKLQVASSFPMETVSFDIIDPKAVAEEQELCQEVKNCKLGNHPVALSFDNVDIDGTNLFCEVSGPKARPLLPKPFRKTILEAYHGIDHAGKAESIRRAASSFFWSDLKKEMNSLVEACHPCKSTKPSKAKEPNLGHFPVPQRRFSHIHVDVCGPLPPSRGHRFLLTVICRSTRFFDAIPMVNASTKDCADALLHHWTSKWGLSKFCTSDNGSEFVSQVWKSMQETLGVKLNYTSVYSPQTNGLIERQHSTLKTSLKAALVQMGEQYKERWYDFLPWVLLNKRVAYQKQLGTSPSMLVMGFNPAIPGDLLRDPGQELSGPDLKELVEHMNKVDNLPPKPTFSPKQTNVVDPPQDVTHVYAKEHKVTGLQPSYTGPYAVVDRPTRTTVKIRVGSNVRGEPRYQIRHWRDLKVYQASPEVEEAERPKRGRPSKSSRLSPEVGFPENKSASPVESGDQTKTKFISTEINKQDGIIKPPNSNRPIRSTRNQSPNYVDSVELSSSGPPPVPAFPKAPRPWSASASEIAALNASITSVPASRNL